ncbi:hypothetical protein chiPu_0005195 [Chiloscyllium punctatum]|uniref:Dynein heavy chain 9, axonemal n=1 Tax=Chiloscyllium punctatum TaxID=137246 RepID=A0A401S8Q2_CHIPU|nr:hypothetical protein [Chiloscyllium punctatum]
MGDSSSDQRWGFLQDYVLKALKLKAERWQKCTGTEEHRLVIQEFVENSEQTVLVLSLNPAGHLVPSLHFPNLSKNKAVFFVKRHKEKLTADSMRTNLLFGDLAYCPLDQFAALVDEVVMPVLTNSRNHNSWPQVVSQDVVRHVHSLKSNVFVVVGQVKGKTLLPLPVGAGRAAALFELGKNGDVQDKGIVHSIESVIIAWSHQINEVLKKDSSEPLLKGCNPNPNVELEFWKNRCTNLACIYDQLKSRKVQLMVELLERMESSYFPVFKTMFSDVVAALTEARDINLHLKPLQRHFEDIESVEFNESRTYLNPEDILKGEVEESLSKVQEAVEILCLFKQMYEEKRGNLQMYYKEDENVKEWDFNSLLIFTRMNSFLERLQQIENFLVTAQDIFKLEKLEFGGIRGKILSQQVARIYEEFQEMYKTFTDHTYDSLHPANQEFAKDFSVWKQKVEDFDRRLATIFGQAFDDAPALEHAFKLLDMFGSLLERPLIAADASDKYPRLIVMYTKELDDVKHIYNRQMEKAADFGFPPVNKNMPAVGGGLRWALELRERIQVPFNCFKSISHPCMDCSEGKQMIRKYEEMMELLDMYEAKLYLEWSATVAEKSQYNLTQPLLKRDPETKLISVNFDPQLVSVLREVKYLEARHTVNIPDAAAEIYSMKESYRQYVATLDLTTNWYNKVQTSVLGVEFPLIEDQVKRIDSKLKEAEVSLNWKNEGIWDYIQAVRDMVHDLESRVQKTKDNVTAIRNIMKTWVSPLFERKEGKKDALLNLDDKNERLEKRYSLIQQTGEKIHSLVKENLSLFQADETSSDWKAYVDYIDEMVIDGFFNAIESSLNYFTENTDPNAGFAPLFEAQLDLVSLDLVFRPSLEMGTSDSFYDMVDGLINDVFKMSSLVPRLAEHNTFPHYQADMEDMADLVDMRQNLMDSIQQVMAKCCNYQNSFEQYAYLWVDDRKEFMRQFLLYGHVLTAEEIEAHAEDGVPESPPTLEQYKEQVDSYEKIYDEVNHLESINIFDSWMRIDARPFKSTLLNIIKKWSLMFKQHLIDHVTNSLTDLQAFIEIAEGGLRQKVEEGDLNGLIHVMGHLMAVKERQVTTNEMFEPLKQTIELLKTYEQELPEDVYRLLEELPEKWNNIKKLAITTKQQVAPLQANEVTVLRKKCASFDVEQHKFRERFRKEAPFRVLYSSFESSVHLPIEENMKQIPERLIRWDSKRFDGIDVDFKELAWDAQRTPNVVEATNKPGLCEKLEDIQSRLALCEKALAEYLDTKRLAFPRFYFISSADLLDILSNGTNPHLVQRHLSKLFDNMASMKFQTEADDKPTKMALGMYSKEDEYVNFKELCDCSGQVEVWLNRVLDSMRETVRHEMTEGVVAYEEKQRDQWLFDYPAQVALSCTQIWWTTEVGISFARLEEGYENAMKEYYKKQVNQLNTLITMLIGQLSKGDRQKIMTICTIDVHARDVVAKIIAQKVDNSQAFIWLSQLRHRWDDETKHCFANICDAQFLYSYEYLGNTPRLVITPLTDRCYITLTQSLHLTMSGAPAGPAGTGKTETTKDLGRALGIMVYVFNCSEQMDYKSCGNIYKGLAQTGAWGCFDEFNRICVEVLSVVAVQVKSIQDAIRDKKKRFNFMGEEINLTLSVGIFITMNPGYAGRTELPENLKALFRPCAMVVPDFELICEIMLVAEGFIEARLLARKFITLYQLCKELLSKQDHYDWGLRAIKSVLVVAGSLKRGDPGRPEDQVLMRALRDFNIPKIVTDDMPIFMGLISDLFPALDVPRKRDLPFESLVKQSILDLKLQAEDNFILKVVQLEEMLEVRHSVFVVGNAGTGKSQVMKSLYKTYQNMKRRPVWADLNPKAVTNDELFGIINPATREWKDGLFSCIMRDLANVTHDGPKWIVLDGDIDPMWIESLNTVMDDNKVLTLASNERIPLNPTMRLLFEISHLRTATPATVSRAGILYINPADLGWNPPVSSWIDKREVQSEKANLTILFEKYLPLCLDTLRTRFKKIIPVPEQSMVQMLCYLLECLLTKENTPPDCHKDLYELYFIFAAIWAFGGAMFQDQLIDYRVEFSKWWTSEFKTVKFPSHGTVFDYYIDSETKKFEPWSKLIPKFNLDPDIPLQACLVHTIETIRIRYFMEKLLDRRRPVMLVGNAGTGKSVLVGEKLGSLDPDEHMVKNVPFNYYTTSAMLQAILEKPLEKKAGRNYGPPGTKRLIYFIDDMNMPEVDTYGTVQPHTLIRQHLDYNHWYDRNKLSLKEIHNVQYVSCMNPTAGSFTINPRLQRHFCVFALSFPGVDALATIYSTILSQHLKLGNFAGPLQKSTQQLINLALALHQKVASTFLPTAIKFHYIFNLRDLSNIFQGILFSTTDCLKTPQDLVKLYQHESNRVYRDKMVEERDFSIFDKIQTELVNKLFDDMQETLEQTKIMNMYCHFACGIGEPKYMPVQNWESLNKILMEALDGYNELNAAMSLVLFEDAMSHICRINRILESPRGNALLVGVGGSGKQSLTRLAAYISSLEVFQITLRKGYNIPDLKTDLGSLYLNAGVKNLGTVFLMTDAQVADEKFLVLVNDLLASGEIPDLLPDEEVENIINNVRNEVKGLGLIDTRENCWKFFIDRVRRQLKVALCFSPVGNKLRIRGRKFPAVVNCTAIDWFHEWPREALESVSLRFLQETDNVDPAIKDSVSKFMAYVHITVNEISKSYLANDRRYNYTTPKSFLEQIKLYQNLLAKKSKELTAKMERLENGLEKLNSTSAQVDDLKAKLAAQEVELKQKNEDADKLIQVVGVETEKVSKEKAIADGEEQKVALIAEEVTRTQKDCEEDLAKAEPALVAAQEALNTLNKQLNANLAKLTAKFEQATADKLKCQQEAESTERTIALANRLVGGLASENVRWAEAVRNFKKQESMLCGDVLLITAFVSYLGYFTKRYRQELMDGMWKPYLGELKVPIPVTSDLDPLTMLTDDADVATWQNEGLPADRMSTENATILTNCERWPLVIDPQLQGIKWIKNKYGENLRVVRIGQRGYLDIMENALGAGEAVLIENLEESVDPVLGPLLGRETIKKGRCIKIGDKECEYNSSFRLILHTKLANPHYQPEMQAQCTLINFTVTRDGLEDQLLAAVVSMERPDLEELKSNLTKQQNGFKITLKTLEDNLLSRLSSASGNFLGDTALVENLETTKRTAAEIEEKVKEAKVTELKINEAREHYRPAAGRASLLYFIMNDLNKIHPMYQFSLKAFSVVFQMAVKRAPADEVLKQRVANLIDSITFSVFQYTTRGLFECDKLTYTAQVTFQVFF